MHSNTINEPAADALPRTSVRPSRFGLVAETVTSRNSRLESADDPHVRPGQRKISLRDIQTALGPATKLYHLGLPRSNVPHWRMPMPKRDPRIMENLLPIAGPLSADRPEASSSVSRIPSAALTPPSSTYACALSLAKFRQTKGAIKLHCQLDLRGQSLPSVVMTDCKCSDDQRRPLFLDLLPDSIYVFDRGYLDFDLVQSY